MGILSIWARILAVDPTVQVDLLNTQGYKYFAGVPLATFHMGSRHAGVNVSLTTATTDSKSQISRYGPTSTSTLANPDHSADHHTPASPVQLQPSISQLSTPVSVEAAVLNGRLFIFPPRWMRIICIWVFMNCNLLHLRPRPTNPSL